MVEFSEIVLCFHYPLTLCNLILLSHFIETVFVKVTDVNHSAELTVQIICLYFT